MESEKFIEKLRKGGYSLTGVDIYGRNGSVTAFSTINLFVKTIPIKFWFDPKLEQTHLFANLSTAGLQDKSLDEILAQESMGQIIKVFDKKAFLIAKKRAPKGVLLFVLWHDDSTKEGGKIPYLFFDGDVVEYKLVRLENNL